MKQQKFPLCVMVCLLCTLLCACSCEHTWKEATCSMPKTCTECGETEGDIIPHSWQEATCTKAAECVMCGTRSGEPLGHEWQDATCTEGKTCRECSKVDGDPLGHSWVDATCTTSQTCSVCALLEGEPLGHSIDTWNISKAPTCSEEGEEKGICTICQEELTQAVDKKEHTEGTWKITEEATDTSSGTRTVACRVCGESIKTESYELTKEEKLAYYKKSCNKYAYNTLARDPNTYKGERVTFSGYVVQVIEDDNEYQLRVRIGSWDNILFVFYEKDSTDPRILEDDYITLYGTFYGTITYETVMGASVTIPAMLAKYATY